MPKPARRIINANRDRSRDAQSEQELEVRFLAILPAARFVLKKLLEMLRQFRRSIRIAQFVENHASPDRVCAEVVCAILDWQ